ncbi:4'-phosphopantetheinyl transferase family protein [Spirillospora sp. CA-294931]|uniref:4'-phosphopantetheinyl transferase family protein n=1 Tax=Spirillospora sp. CA-294931 TaxID=3240042 RepID=UPI003D89BDB6
MIEEILPGSAMTAEAFGDELFDAEIFPEEERVIARAVAKRRNDFISARACARQALGKLGVDPVPILPGERGAPGWPPGIVGSMTHCEGYRAAAVARSSDLISLGLDAEPDGPLPEGVLDQIARAEELPRLAALPPGVHWDRLLFSAKESIYKTWFPLARRWLGFEEASVTFGRDGTFTATILQAGPPAALAGTVHGRWLARDGLVVTAIAV